MAKERAERTLTKAEPRRSGRLLLQFVPLFGSRTATLVHFFRYAA